MPNDSERQQRNLRSLEFMATNRVFTLDEFAAYLGSPRNIAQYRVRYYMGEGRLKRVANGVYSTVPVGVDPEQFEPDVFLAAAAIRPDALFAYHSALDLLGQGHSVWWTCTVCTSRPRSPVVLGRSTVKFLTHPSAIRRQVLLESVRSMPEQLWTVEIRRQERTLRVTTPERTLVDGFRELSLVGGLDELVDSMNGFAALDPGLLKEVLNAYDNKRLWAAVGWYLGRRRRSLFLEDTVLREFKANRPRTRVYLVPGQRGGVVDNEWNLVVPEHLHKTTAGYDDGP